MARVKTVKAIKNKVLSAKVTPDVYTAWNGLAESTGRSVSECLRDAIVIVDGKAIIKAQDGIVVPDDLQKTIGAIGGGTVAGILSYKAIKAVFENNPRVRLTEGEIEAFAMMIGLMGGLLAGTGILAALNRLER